MKVRLTETSGKYAIPSLRPAPGKPQSEYLHTLTPGAGVRIGAGGRRTFFMLYYFEGKRKRLDLGEHTSSRGGRVQHDPEYKPLTLKAFEAAYHDARAKLYKGIDPDPAAIISTTSTNRPEEPAKLIESIMLPEDLQKTFPEGVRLGTVGFLLSEYLAKHAAKKLKPRGYSNYKQITRGYLRSIYSAPLLTFAPIDVITLCEEIEKRAPKAVKGAKNVLSCAFKFGIAARCYGLSVNPCQGISAGVKAKRERYLTDPEISKLFDALPRLTDQKAADTYLLILSSMCRPGEAAAIRAEDVVVLNSERVWRIRDPKNGREHLVPLLGFIGEIINRRCMAVGGSGPLFWNVPPTKDYPEPLKKANKELRELTGLDFRPHDLRRTGRTHIPGLGVVSEVGESLLNHKPEGVQGVYNLYEYWNERKSALRLWHAKLEKLQAGEVEEMAA